MKKALVIVDLEKGFITKHTKDIPRRTRNFLKANGSKYDLVVFTQYKNHAKSNFVKNLRWRGSMTRDTYAIVDELKDFVTKRNVFPKDTYGSFVKGKLPQVLKKNNIGEVHIAGIDTENCVLAFARDAFDRGYKVVVLKKLCGSHSNPALHEAALRIIANNIGEVR
jgi:nicotinamidase-related amidase